ncbi:hypothetical protein Gasu2_04380 [Galdieria sulphuraria]|uniref:Pentatricopeptide (PPR) repeat-containing protein n=1 Tax=Galdieria sulphuraria TaxID=130081 RepID=M2WZH5_GALSU|nr:pentatricopeptide (PPR) repeat-containing protein [Galdieria sulphuraria]EME29485.1 pentatricopeptide (PPR) repeat-containing protein [Galdieria sulphuraria]GJD05997.1 hypothetical protein Gasu2_04380 [Galdieria sulphuraria]|eukprot:XP_005706005.1 pentatricopeptide (PPR) repeat-containing protein [Galdieria sulphuraria]
MGGKIGSSMLLCRNVDKLLVHYMTVELRRMNLSSKASFKGVGRKTDSSSIVRGRRVDHPLLQLSKWEGKVEEQASPSSVETNKLYEALTAERVEADCLDLVVPESAKKLYGRIAGSKIAFSGYLDPYLALEKWSSRFVPSTTSFALRIRTLGLVGKYEDISSVLERMELLGIRPNMEVYYSLAFAYSRVGNTEELFGVLKKVEASGYPLDNALLCTLVTSLMKQGDIANTLELLMRREFRDLRFPLPIEATMKTAVTKNTNNKSSKKKRSTNKPAALTVAKFSDEFQKKLHHISHGHDVVIWTAFMKGLLDLGDYRRTLEVFDHMRLRGLEPDCVTYDIAIQACGYLEDMMRAKEIFRCFPQGQEKIASGAVYSSLIFCAANCNDAQAAESFYQEAIAEDIPLGYRGRFHLLRAYGKQGIYDRAVHIYESLRSLPRSTLPSVHDWFLLFLSFKQGLKQYRKEIIRKASETDNLGTKRDEIIAFADRYIEEGLQLAIDCRHLYGVKERYLDVCLLSGRMEESLKLLQDMSRDSQLPFHLNRTQGCFYRAWARYILEKGSTVERVEEGLKEMRQCGVEWNEPAILAAVCMYSELRCPQKALDLLREVGFQGFWLNIGKSIRVVRDENSEHYLVASHEERLDALKRLRDACMKHSPGLVSILKSYIEQVGYQNEKKKLDSCQIGEHERLKSSFGVDQNRQQRDPRKEVLDLLMNENPV